MYKEGQDKLLCTCPFGELQSTECPGRPDEQVTVRTRAQEAREVALRDGRWARLPASLLTSPETQHVQGKEDNGRLETKMPNKGLQRFSCLLT